MAFMFDGYSSEYTNYDATLTGWATLDAGETQIPTNITFDGGNSQYSTASRGPSGADRYLRLDDHRWGAIDCSSRNCFAFTRG